MKHELTANQEQYLKGLFSVELPIIISTHTREELESISESIYPLIGNDKKYLKLAFLLADDGERDGRIKSLLENPTNKIIFSQNMIPYGLEHALSDYLLINVKLTEDGLYSITSKLTELSKTTKKVIKLRPTDPRLQAPKYTGDEAYKYIVYDERGKVRKSEVITVNSFTELEIAVDLAESRRTLRTSQTAMLGKDIGYDTTFVFEIKVDSINLSNSIIGDYTERMRKVGKISDIFIVALVNV